MSEVITKRLRFCFRDTTQSKWVYKRADVGFRNGPYDELRETISLRYGIGYDNFDIYCGMDSVGAAPQTLSEKNDLIPVTDSLDVRELGDGESVFIYPKEKTVANRELDEESNPAQQSSKRARTSMQIYVKFVAGATLTLDVVASDTIQNVRDKIQDQHGIYPHGRVIFRGGSVGSCRTLSDCNVQNGDTLDVAG